MERQSAFDEALEQIVLDLGIPPCPDILTNLSVEAQENEPDLRRIERLISADVALSAALIKTVNSPFYGLRTKVHTIAQAIQVLGLNSLWLVVMGMVLRDTLQAMCRVDMQRFWDVSAKMAAVSAYIACRLPSLNGRLPARAGVDRDEVYTYGLFQDCGIPILLNNYPRYKETLSMANHALKQGFTELEDAAHATNHTMVGYLLSKSWGLPEELALAIRHHHEHVALMNDPDYLGEPSRNLIAIALLAEHVIQEVSGQAYSCEWGKGEQWVCRHFGLTEQDVKDIVEGTRVLYQGGFLDNKS